jgi:signal transduction histidine kinase
VSSPGYRRQVLLFLGAIILPCIVLVAMSVRMMAQQRELAEKRLADERSQVVRNIHQELVTRLERIALQEASSLAAGRGPPSPRHYENPEVVLVGRIEGDRLLLPWEAVRKGDETRFVLAEAALATTIRQGESREFVDKDFAGAATKYRDAMAASHHPALVGQAQLRLARALRSLGRRDEALINYRTVLSLPWEVTDEHGNPLFLYAAAGLLETDAEKRKVIERLTEEMERQGWVPPTAAAMLQGLAAALMESGEPAEREAAETLWREFVAYRDLVEQALALRDDFPRLGLLPTRRDRTADREARWVPYGSDDSYRKKRWLVTVAPPIGTLAPVAVVVRAEAILEPLEAIEFSGTAVGRARVVTDGSTSGESLAPVFPELRVVFEVPADAEAARRWNPENTFYVVIVIVVLSVTLFGAYLVWRDVRRELGLAQMRSQFVSSVSHELKTPLTSIRMFAETLRMGRTRDEATRNEYLETISNECERLTRLLNNVLDFSKIEQGQKSYHFRQACLADTVRTAARAMRYPLSQEGHRLRVDLEETLPETRIDPDALEQAILNLLANAMKYSPEGSEIDLRLARQDSQAVIQVTDRGVGIPREQHARIFEKFYRLSTQDNELVPGTGLGLTLVEHIANAHGGHVDVTSTVGQGSTFSIHLPLRTEE